ncbi:MAG: hypothetical protein WDO72_11955 [Pseudomonadota bacterium]
MKTTTRCVVLSLALIGTCAAQTPYPQTGYPQQPYQQFQQQPAGQSPMRAMFASSVAQMAQATGSAAIVAVADGLTGALKTWFDNKRVKKGANGALGNNYYPAPVAAPIPGTPMTPQSYPAGTAPDGGSYPQPGDPNAYPASAPYDPNASYPPTDAYPPADAYPPTNTYPPAGGGYQAPAAAPPSQLYAGIAYEIHLLQPDGSTLPVDPASYNFRTGDQFRVYYRPSLPGRVDVFNINALGQNSQIDSSVVAAGQLASLGPYQFTDSQGEETLILKLSACVTPQTYAITRTIVKAQGAPNQVANNPMGFDDCNNTATRGLKKTPKTRDIRKVSVEGGTAFALDPISPAELGSGDMSPRQVTITLHHR